MEHLWNTAQQKGNVAYNGAKGAKTAYFCAFCGALRKMFHGEHPRKRLIICFVWKLGMSGLFNEKVPYF